MRVKLKNIQRMKRENTDYTKTKNKLKNTDGKTEKKKESKSG